ncbi:MAG: Epoxide hydrolase [Labilithrix sp.]|nr:Epoxide hydrolase [Labilithrix sp.]
MPKTSPELVRLVANGLEHRVLAWSAQAPGSLAVETVVLVHGFMDAAGTWDLVAPRLAAAGLRVLALDMRGFGEGARIGPGSAYHFVDYVFDLADIVDTLAPGEPVFLVGHSMGGTLTTMFAGAFPERVARFANLEGLGPPDNGWEAGPVRMRAWIEQVRAMRTRGDGRPTFTREEALQRLSANHPGIDAAVLEGRLPHLARDAGDGRLAWHFDGLHRATSPVPFFAKLFAAYASKVTAPVLYVSGGPKGFHVPDEEQRLASFTQLTRAELPGAGHMMHWTRPEALADLLIAHGT